MDLVTYIPETKTACIGHPTNDDLTCVQLKTASSYNWKVRDIRAIEVRNVMINDESDVSFLVILICLGWKVNLDGAHILPSILPNLSLRLTTLSDFGCSVTSGSKISIPSDNGKCGMARTDSVRNACARIGFGITEYL